VDSRGDYDSLAVLDGVRVRLEGRDDDHLTVVTRNGGGQGTSS
jgi:hypothetical protein